MTRILLTTWAVLAVTGASAADSLYISSSSANSVVEIDPITGALKRTISAPGVLFQPGGLALSPDRSILYVGGAGSSQADVYLFNTSTGALVNQFSSIFLTGTGGLALKADGSLLYAAGTNSSSVVSFNTSNGSSTIINVSDVSNPHGIRLSANETSLYVANTTANNIRELSVPSGSVIRTINAPGASYLPTDVVFSPDLATLYASTFGATTATDNKVLKYRTSDGAFLGEYSLLNLPNSDLMSVVRSPDGATLYISDQQNNHNNIRVLDVATGDNSILATEATLSAPSYMLYVQSVPEPATVACLCVAGVAAGTYLWRRRRVMKREGDVAIEPEPVE